MLTYLKRNSSNLIPCEIIYTIKFKNEFQLFFGDFFFLKKNYYYYYYYYYYYFICDEL